MTSPTTTEVGRGMRYLSVCSGIEAASVAWEALGWSPVGFSEIDKFASAVLAERFGSNLPGEPLSRNAPPNFGDFTAIPIDELGTVDLLVGGTPCFPGDVRIACRHGLIPIAEVNVGDEVLTHEGRWRRVLATGSKTAPTIRLKGQGQSYGLVTTAEHPFYSRKKSSVWAGRENGSYASQLSEPEWVEASQMRGRMWASPASWPASEPPAMGTEGREQACPEMSAELAWVIGRWLGDGWCRVNERRGYAIICCGRHEADLLATAIARSGLAFSRLQERTTERFQIASRSFARWLTGQFGSGAGEKTMPTWVFGWEHRSALLDGYLSADGSRAANGHRLTTVSDALALSTVLLAHSLGFSASRSRNAPQRDTRIEGRAVSERPFWTVKIYDRARSSIEVGIHRWGVVRSIEDAGDAEVFNLEVEGDNSYVADGFVVHNCQAFSFAGKRLSLADARGNLTLAYAVLAHELAGSHGLRNALWENVPGVLSTEDNAFGCFLGALVGADDALDLPKGVKRWPDAGMVAGPRARAAWRVLDAQYFGLAQRRERVFVVVDFGNGADPAAVLFEPQGLQGDSPPRREAGQVAAGTLSARTTGGGGLGADFEVNGGPVADDGRLAYGGGNRSGPVEVAATLTAKGQRIDFEVETFIAGPAHTLRGEGFDASEDGTGRGTPIVPVALRGHSDYGDGLPCLRAEGGDAGGGSEALIAFDARQSDVLVYGSITGPLDTAQPGPAIAFSCKDHGADAGEDIAPTLRAMGHGESHPNAGGQVAVAFAIQERAVSENPDAGPDGIGVKEGVAYTLEARTTAQGVAYGITADALDRHGEGAGGTAAERSGLGITEELSPTLKAKRPNAVAAGWGVRRLLPHECARLQGFPDHHARIAWRGKPAELCPDGPQYKTYGNSFAVPVVRWIGERIAAHSIAKRTAA